MNSDSKRRNPPGQPTESPSTDPRLGSSGTHIGHVNGVVHSGSGNIILPAAIGGAEREAELWATEIARHIQDHATECSYRYDPDVLNALAAGPFLEITTLEGKLRGWVRFARSDRGRFVEDPNADEAIRVIREDGSRKFVPSSAVRGIERLA